MKKAAKLMHFFHPKYTSYSIIGIIALVMEHRLF